MCHLILLMPVFALVVFWVWPLTVAAPVYAGVTALSFWMYVLIMRAMQRPVVSGAEEILHSIGEVMDVEGKALRVHVHSEMWNAESSEPLHRGDRVKVVGMKGLVLRVARCEGSDDEI